MDFVEYVVCLGYPQSNGIGDRRFLAFLVCDPKAPKMRRARVLKRLRDQQQVLKRQILINPPSAIHSVRRNGHLIDTGDPRASTAIVLIEVNRRDPSGDAALFWKTLEKIYGITVRVLYAEDGATTVFPRYEEGIRRTLPSRRSTFITSES